MAKLGGAFLRLLQTVLYAIEFCCAGIILGIYSYFLAVQADRDAVIPTWQKAVEGLSGAAVLYLIFAVILTCFLGGIRVFAFIAIVLDVLFCGAMVAIAVMTRDGAHSCTGNVNTPLGAGNTDQSASGYGNGGWGFGGDNNATYAASPGLACRLNSACFAVSIIAALLFLVSAAVQLVLARHHQKEKRYGPSPKNNYTSGTGRRNIFARKNKKANKHATQDAELGATGGLATTEHGAYRPSHDTGYTGSTVAAPNTATYDAHGKPLNGSHGYHGAPHGTAVNPYGYDNTHTTGTATNY